MCYKGVVVVVEFSVCVVRVRLFLFFRCGGNIFVYDVCYNVLRIFSQMLWW